MIVLDEQLLGYGLDAEIQRWYRGTVTVITQLRPGTVIKDEAIPTLLRAARQPTFVTLNASRIAFVIDAVGWDHCPVRGVS